MSRHHLHQLSDWTNHRYRKALEACPEDEDLVRLYIGVAFALVNLEKHLERLNHKQA